MNKNILGIATVAVLGIVAVGGYYYGFTGEKVSANPDFICVKSVTGESCRITSCGAWQTDGTRVCNGKRTTKVGYYHTRTTCESGYSVALNGQTGTSNSASTKAPSSTLDSEGLKATTIHPSSGRHGSDYIYNEENCTTTEKDDIAPNAKVTSDGTSIN